METCHLLQFIQDRKVGLDGEFQAQAASDGHLYYCMQKHKTRAQQEASIYALVPCSCEPSPISRFPNSSRGEQWHFIFRNGDSGGLFSGHCKVGMRKQGKCWCEGSKFLCYFALFFCWCIKALMNVESRNTRAIILLKIILLTLESDCTLSSAQTRQGLQDFISVFAKVKSQIQLQRLKRFRQKCD